MKRLTVIMMMYAAIIIAGTIYCHHFNLVVACIIGAIYAMVVYENQDELKASNRKLVILHALGSGFLVGTLAGFNGAMTLSPYCSIGNINWNIIITHVFMGLISLLLILYVTNEDIRNKRGYR